MAGGFLVTGTLTSVSKHPSSPSAGFVHCPSCVEVKGRLRTETPLPICSLNGRECYVALKLDPVPVRRSAVSVCSASGIGGVLLPLNLSGVNGT